VGDAGAFGGAQNVPDHMNPGDTHDTYWKNARFTLKTWTGQETELGTLKTYTETRFNFGNTRFSSEAYNKGASLNFAWIQLGGLRVGKDESAFDTFIGYAGNVIQDTIVPYGDFDTNVIQYYFDAGNGFSAVVSLEEGAGVVGTIDSYVPHVVGGVKWTQGWGAITGVVAYDSNYEQVTGKVRLDVNVNDQISLFGMFGYGNDGDLNDNAANAIDANGRGFYKIWGGNWAWWAGGTYKFNEKTAFNLQVSGDDDKNYGVAANVAYTAVPGFTITAEVDYNHYGNFDTPTIYGNFTGADKKNSVGGILRFQRDF
jgi:hypothetical protein